MSWLLDYQKYTEHTEAPRLLHLLSGLSAIAAVLKRQVWLDMVHFKWYPSLYVVLVAKPGVVAKSTTLSVAASLVRHVKGVNIGADSATWQALSAAIAESSEMFEFNGEFIPEAAMCFFSSEYGSLMDLYNQDMVNFFIDMWDGKDTYKKLTKTSGSEMIEGPIISLIAGTTPAWLNLNMSTIAAAGGLTSRTLFAFADEKEKFIAYPDEVSATNLHPEAKQELKEKLIAGLQHMSTLRGPLLLTEEAREFGREWYTDLWGNKAKLRDEPWYEGYIARAQTQLHKLAICFAIADGLMEIRREHILLASGLLEQLEEFLPRVFMAVGKSAAALASDKLLAFIARHEQCTYAAAIKYIKADLPDFRNFESVVKTLLQSNQLKLVQEGTQILLKPGSEFRAI